MVKYTWPRVLLATFLACKVSGQYTCMLELESENGDGGNQQYRSRASGGQTARLLEGETINHHLVFPSTDNACTIQLSSITYSNDGTSDEIKVTIDGTLLGSFTTYSHSNSGEYWNTFMTERDFLSKIEVHNMHSIITVEAVDSDEYGVEIDMISLQMDCTNDIGDSTECPPDIVSSDDEESDENQNNRLSDGAIVGIVFGTVALIISIPGCIVATKKCMD